MGDFHPIHDVSADRRYFFDEGIRFECTGCGRCCTGAPGQVILGEEEIDRIAARLGLSRAEFLRTYTRSVPDGVSLVERPGGDCILLDGARCSVHDCKPAQCGTFPFWAGNLRNERNWEETRRRCEGIGRGRLYSREEILAFLRQDRTRTDA